MLTTSERSGSELTTYESMKNEIFNTLHCATIGVVTAFDSGTTSLTVKPLINERTVNGKGVVKYVDYPEMSETPYLSFNATQPNPGDPCLLIYCDSDISAWWNGSTTKWSGSPKTCSPETTRSHNINNVVAVMGLHVKQAFSNTTYTNTPITASTVDDGTGISPALLSFLESWEGFVASDQGAAAHSVDYWNTTVGYGHILTSSDNFTFPLTKPQAETILKNDLVQFINSVKKEFAGHTLTQNQFDALVSISENCGAYMWSGANLTNDVKNNADAATITRDFQAWSHVKSTEVSGLLRRRTAEAAMFNTGAYQNND